MIPERELLFNEQKGVVEMPSLTYAINFKNDDVCMTGGCCDGLTAMEQAVYKILRTQRDKFFIYKNYGTEIFSLFGQPRAYAMPELERMIREALLYDSRITEVDNFVFDIENIDKSSVAVSFDVHTIFGDIAVPITTVI